MRNLTQDDQAALDALLKNAPKGSDLSRLLRQYRRGTSNPRLVDIARAHRVDGPRVLDVLRAFA